jgi:hypothetical protein
MRGCRREKAMRVTIWSLSIVLLLACSALRTPAAPRPASAGLWTLLLQLPSGRPIRVERGGQTLTGTPSALVARLRQGRGGVRATRRVVAGTVSVESRRVRQMQVAGNMLLITVAPTPNRRVRLVSTNRLPMSDDPTRRMLLNLQLVAEDELHARASFAVVDEPGRTAVLFQ